MTIAEQVKQTQIKKWVMDTIVIVGYGFLIGLSAQVRIPLSFSPVPITAQTLVVLLAGGLLGAKRASLAAVAYIILGSVGWLPFAGGILLGPTGGYLLGFVVASYFVGLMVNKGWTQYWWTTIAILLMANGLIYVFGLSWLSRFVGWPSVFALGFYPFIIGDLLKILCAFGMMRALQLKY